MGEKGGLGETGLVACRIAVMLVITGIGFAFVLFFVREVYGQMCARSCGNTSRPSSPLANAPGASNPPALSGQNPLYDHRLGSPREPGSPGPKQEVSNLF